MKRRRPGWAWLAALCVMGGAQAAAPRSAAPVSVAVCDYVVSGLAQPRFWLGYVYAEVLAQRLQLAPELVVVDPLATRAHQPTIALRDATAVTEHLGKVAEAEGVSFALGGLIEDQGGTLTVTAIVVPRGTGRPWSLSQQAGLEAVFDTQAELAVKRFLPNMGVRLAPDALQALSTWQPQLTPETMQLVGEGWRAYAPDDPGAAFRLWEQALQQDPDCVLAAEALARTSYQYRRFLLDRSLKFYQDMVARHPDDAMAHYHLGEIYADLRQYRDAERELKIAVRLRPRFIDGQMALGVVMLEQGVWQQAESAFAAVLAMVPNHLKALHNRAVALYRGGEQAAAVAMWQHILKLYPGDALATERLEKYGLPSGPVAPEDRASDQPQAAP